MSQPFWSPSAARISLRRVTTFALPTSSLMRRSYGGALSFLEKFPDAGLAEGNWAWTTLWNLWEQIEPAAQARLVKHLIEEAPWDDQVLWMIGDGPLSEVANEPANLAVIEGDEAIREKVARIRRPVEV